MPVVPATAIMLYHNIPKGKVLLRLGYRHEMIVEVTYLNGHGSKDKKIGEIEDKSRDQKPKLILLSS